MCWLLRSQGLKESGARVMRAGAALTTDELLRDLRATIFQSRRGECLTGALLNKLYDERNDTAAVTTQIAHAVSCPRCLDEINRRLGLAPLCERYPTDTLEKEARPKDRDDDDDGAGGDMTGTGPEAEEFYRRGKRRAREVFEHRPQELCISVNGQLVATQKIGAAFNEQSLSLSSGEGVDFIEVVSEQNSLAVSGPQRARGG